MSGSRDTSKRRELIIKQLKDRGSVQVYELANQFEVSTVTIRKDLKFLDEQGIAARAYGGAILNDTKTSLPENPVAHKSLLHAEEKACIGRAAAEFIVAGDSVILNSGTTTLQIAKHLSDKQQLTIITNGLNIMNELARYDHLKAMMLGGTLRPKSMSLLGGHAKSFLEELHVDKLYLGVGGFCMEHGITTHLEAEAMLNRQMCRAANEIIVVVDSSKFGGACLHKVWDVNLISKVITDSNIPQEYHDNLTALGVEVIVVNVED